MIYNKGFFSKERKQAFTENSIRGQKMVQYDAFLALFSFSAHFMLLTLIRSVFADAFPELMMESMFSVMSLYNIVSYLFFAIYFSVYYEYLTFAEVTKNKWYTPVKMGYSPYAMIFQKLGARILEVIGLYAGGFFGTILLASFLKYPIIPGYLVSLFISGIIDILFITMISMSLSLVIQQQKDARYIIAITTVVIWVLRSVSGFYSFLSNRQLMTNPQNMFSSSNNTYLIYFALTVACSLAFCVIRARYVASYSTFAFYKGDMDYGEGVSIVVGDGATYSKEQDAKYMAKFRRRARDILVSTALVVILAFFICFNGLILVMSFASAGMDVSIFGIVPYVFHSDTMEPSIRYNDLAFFRNTDEDTQVQVDDIVMFRKSETTSVARIIADNGETVSVDIDYYPSGYQKGVYAEEVNKSTITGVYTGASRWLGALILFANTFFGRLLMLIVPSLLIFFYKPITEKLGSSSKRRGLKE